MLKQEILHNSNIVQTYQLGIVLTNHMQNHPIKNQIIFLVSIVAIVFAVKGILLIKTLRGNVQTLVVQNQQEKKVIGSMQNDIGILYSFVSTEFPDQQKDFIARLKKQAK